MGQFSARCGFCCSLLRLRAQVAAPTEGNVLYSPGVGQENVKDFCTVLEVNIIFPNSHPPLPSVNALASEVRSQYNWVLEEKKKKKESCAKSGERRVSRPYDLEGPPTYIYQLNILRIVYVNFGYKFLSYPKVSTQTTLLKQYYAIMPSWFVKTLRWQLSYVFSNTIRNSFLSKVLPLSVSVGEIGISGKPRTSFRCNQLSNTLFT